jgi:hypothetical protein
MHEPLTVGLFFPTLNYEPWDWRAVAWMGNFGQAMSALHKQGDAHAGNHLREFWSGAARVGDLSESVVRPVLLNDSWKAFLGLARGRRRRERTTHQPRGAGVFNGA